MKELNVTEMRAAEGGASTISISSIFSLLSDTSFLKKLINLLSAFSSVLTAWNNIESYLK